MQQALENVRLNVLIPRATRLFPQLTASLVASDLDAMGSAASASLKSAAAGATDSCNLLESDEVAGVEQ